MGYMAMNKGSLKGSSPKASSGGGVGDPLGQLQDSHNQEQELVGGLAQRMNQAKGILEGDPAATGSSGSPGGGSDPSGLGNVAAMSNQRSMVKARGFGGGGSMMSASRGGNRAGGGSFAKRNLWSSMMV